MRLSELAVAAAVTVSVAGVSYAVLNTGGGLAAQTVASQASCRTVQAAVVGYVAQHGAAPTETGQLRAWVDGDISAYRIVQGQVTGPGC